MKDFFRYFFVFASMILVACGESSVNSSGNDAVNNEENSSIDNSAGVGSFVTGVLVDSRDGRQYRTTKIQTSLFGYQVWMAENLNYEVDDSRCYGDVPENCEKYGRFYTWFVATSACPEGWHLPSSYELKTLLDVVGDVDQEKVDNLKSVSWSGGVDKFGFSALPVGYYLGDMGYVYYDSGAFFWTSSHEADITADFLEIGMDKAFVNAKLKPNESYASVRCLQD
ncbi:MAG: hypothetical protein MJY85_02875 [Fibrobacter sp.]|nr:hypothetical protein [Fibrobacter sp.]